MPTGLLGGILGLVWGVVADRIAARWPAHEDGAIRPIDWRTPIVVAAGAAAGFLLDLRSAGLGGPGPTLALLALVVAALVLGLATDLDQRLLPDALTYPLIVVALLAWVTGLGPYVHDTTELAFAAAAALIAPGALYLLSIPFGPGAIGQGDLKLLVGVGLLGGPLRLFLGLVTGAIIAAVVIVALIVVRRITLKTYVPYGPFLIAGALWALLGIVDA